MNTQKLIPRSEVQAWLGVGRASLDNWIRAGKFPRAVRLSKVKRGWLPEDIARWEKQRIEERDAATRAA